MRVRLVCAILGLMLTINMAEIMFMELPVGGRCEEFQNDLYGAHLDR